MKVIIDFIEDIRTAINNDPDFSLRVVGLSEQKKSEFVPTWQSELCSYKLDEEQGKIFLFMGKEQGLNVGEFLQMLNALSNDKMMYEICVSYSKENRRIDASLMGFGESFRDKRYLLFIPE